MNWQGMPLCRIQYSIKKQQLIDKPMRKNQLLSRFKIVLFLFILVFQLPGNVKAQNGDVRDSLFKSYFTTYKNLLDEIEGFYHAKIQCSQFNKVGLIKKFPELNIRAAISRDISSMVNGEDSTSWLKKNVFKIFPFEKSILDDSYQIVPKDSVFFQEYSESEYNQTKPIMNYRKLMNDSTIKYVFIMYRVKDIIGPVLADKNGMLLRHSINYEVSKNNSTWKNKLKQDEHVEIDIYLTKD
jgi:hypothetical protein